MHALRWVGETALEDLNATTPISCMFRACCPVHVIAVGPMKTLAVVQQRRTFRINVRVQLGGEYISMCTCKSQVIAVSQFPVQWNQVLDDQSRLCIPSGPA